MQYVLESSLCFPRRSQQLEFCGKSWSLAEWKWTQKSSLTLCPLYLQLWCNSIPNGSHCSRSGKGCWILLFLLFSLLYWFGVAALLQQIMPGRARNPDPWKGTTRAEFLLGKADFSLQKLLGAKLIQGQPLFLFVCLFSCFFCFTIAFENTAMQLLFLIRELEIEGFC